HVQADTPTSPPPPIAIAPIRSLEPPLCAAGFATLELVAQHETCRSAKSVICLYVKIGTRESGGGAVKRFDAGMTQSLNFRCEPPKEKEWASLRGALAHR